MQHLRKSQHMWIYQITNNFQQFFDRCYTVKNNSLKNK